MTDTKHMVELDADNAIHVIHHPPRDGRQTFVFCNSTGASTQAWEARIAPDLRERGFGTLTMDYRGQGETRFGPDARLEPTEIVADIRAVLAAETPHRPILVGLSIGGLYAAEAILAGSEAEKLVLLNTLRKQSTKVEWINTLEERLIAMGGMTLVLDVLRPMLSGPDKLEAERPNHLPDEGYTPVPEDNPRRRLAIGVRKVDWDIAWQDLTLPVLVMTGLQDRLFRIQKDVDELTARIPDTRTITYEDGGHSMHAEYPDRFVGDLIAFADA